MSKHAAIKVLAPIPLIDYSAAARREGGAKAIEVDGDIEVFHPRWLYPPGGTCLNPAILGIRLSPFVRQIRRSFDFDIIDAHFGYPEAVAAAYLAGQAGRPFIVTLRGSELFHSRYRTRRWAMSWALRRAALVIAVSNELRQLAIDLGVPEERAQTIMNGVDSAVFAPRDRFAARQRYGISDGAKVILCVGHLIPLKGHAYVIHALNHMVALGMDVRLLIAGNAGQGVQGCERELRMMAKQLNLENRIQFLGAVKPEDMPDLMSAADVLCLASEREGSPNVVNEALACGTPVVATDVGCVSDLIKPGMGVVVPLGERENLAPYLEGALKEGWDRKGIAAAGALRSWDRVALDVLTCVERI